MKKRFPKRRKQVREALYRIRKDAGLTQKEVAKKMGVYATFVTKVESGEKEIDAAELFEFCKACGVTLADFAKQVGLE